MKQFWKKTNRGLWLGGALLLLTACVIIVTSVIFAVEMPVIRDTAKDYITDLLALNQSPQGAVIGEKLSDAEKKAKEAELEALFKQYWDFEDDSLKRGISGEEMREAYADMLADPIRTIITEENISISNRDITVIEQGPGYASVTIYVENVSLTYTGAPDGVFIGSNPFEYIGEFNSRKDVYLGTYVLNMSLEMHRVNGEWRVISTNGNIYEMHAVQKGGDAE